jgi:ribosome-associated protein
MSVDVPSRGIVVNSRLCIPFRDVRFEFSRSGGPGGQNVNKVSTRVMLRFDVGACEALSAWQRRRIRERLTTRITKDGVFFVVSSKHRTQRANREATVDRFVRLLREAMKSDKTRRATSVPRTSRRRRLDEKRRRGDVKRMRRSGKGEE